MGDYDRTLSQAVALACGIASAIFVAAFGGVFVVRRVWHGLVGLGGGGTAFDWSGVLLDAGGIAAVVGLGAGLVAFALSGAGAIRNRGNSRLVDASGTADGWTPGDVRRWVADDEAVSDAG